MRMLIIGGFLGSGKTSLTLGLLKFIADNFKSDSPYKAVVLENEIGVTGIDDTMLASGDFKVKTLFAGCACCTILGPLLTSVKDIKRGLNPEWLILETTGLAFPNKIRASVRESLGVESRVCVVADASRWKRLRAAMPDFLSDQVSGADVVAVSKIDLAGRETADDVISSIAADNVSARIITCNASGDIDGGVFSSILGI
jgi:G3E family GTPase